MRNFLLLSIVLIASTCSEKESLALNGDLYYHWLDIGSFYNQPDSVLDEAIAYINSKKESELIQEDSAGYMYFKLLRDNDLLTSPWINLRVDKDSIVAIYLSDSDYQKFTNFSYQQLTEDKEKVKVTVTVKHLHQKMFVGTSIIKIERVEGLTFIRPSKMEIKDYR